MFIMFLNMNFFHQENVFEKKKHQLLRCTELFSFDYMYFQNLID